jgi:hypothetical protein
LDDAFRRAYARLDRRFASAGQFAAALEAPAAQEPALAPRAPVQRDAASTNTMPTFLPVERPRRFPIRVVPFLVLLAILVASFILWRHDRSSPAGPVFVITLVLVGVIILRALAQWSVVTPPYDPLNNQAPPPPRRTRRRRKQSAPEGTWPPPAAKG